MSRDRDLSPKEPDIAEDFTEAASVVSCHVPRLHWDGASLCAVAVLCAGAMIARAVYQLDATIRRRDA
jgi:hypothetical protein